MNHNHNRLIDEMIAYEKGVPERIQHFIKVHTFSKMIGEEEGIDERDLYILEAASIVHDIGIKPSIEKYGKGDGPYQEKEGAPLAYDMLKKLGYDEDTAKRVSVLVGRHHTYKDIDGDDCQILIEADFLVNLFEGGASKEAAESVREKIFRTASGIRILTEMFDLR